MHVPTKHAWRLMTLGTRRSNQVEKDWGFTQIVCTAALAAAQIQVAAAVDRASTAAARAKRAVDLAREHAAEVAPASKKRFVIDW